MELTASGRFEAFGWSHYAALAIIAVVSVVAVRSVRAASRSGRWRVVCRSLALILVSNVVAEQIYQVVHGTWSVRHSLPLHLCDIGVLINIAILVIIARRPAARPGSSRNRRIQAVYELAYFWGLGGALQALLTPDIDEAFPGPQYFFYFIGHGAIVTSVLILTLGLGRRPRRGSPLRAWLMTNAVAVMIMPINWLIDANYMFLCGPPESRTVLSLLGDWPIPFLICLDALAAAAIALCYAPYWWRDRVHDPHTRFRGR